MSVPSRPFSPEPQPPAGRSASPLRRARAIASFVLLGSCVAGALFGGGSAGPEAADLARAAGGAIGLGLGSWWALAEARQG